VVDLGGVVARWLPDRRLHELSALSGLPPATIDQLVFTSGFDDAGERGRFDEGEFVEELARLLGLGDRPDVEVALRAAWARAYEVDARVLRLVERAPAPTALFTNNGPLLEAALAAELADIDAAFDRCLLSWRLGAAKPEPAAFELVAAALEVEPGAVLFIDDSEANVDAATAAGWQAHRYTTVLDLQHLLHRTLGG
jgi:putative hydrolase of the HAD superfamily